MDRRTVRCGCSVNEEREGYAGHADVLRESIDGAIGAERRWSNVPPGDEAWWTSYRIKLEDASRQAGDDT